MKKFLVYLLVIVVVVSAGFAVFFLVRDNEVISISNASLYQDVGDTFAIDVNHKNKKNSTTINITSSDDAIVSYNKSTNQFSANNGGIARINFRTTNAKFRNLWCDVIVGDGSAENPFYISTAEQLAAIGGGDETEIAGVFAGAEGYELYESNKYYKLVGNIDASTVNNGYWIPLKNFNGRIDGNGLTISNIYIDKDAYTQSMINNPEYNPTLFTTDNVGFVSTLGKDGAIYNVKFENFNAKGTYENFGTIAGINYGHIERVEVKDATINVKTQVFGGLVAKNITTDGMETIVINNNEQSLEVADGQENITTEEIYVRNIARVDRCSINLNLGSEVQVDASGNETVQFTYNSNTIGGLVGENIGGIIVYSYVNGDVYFGKDSTSDNVITLVYGGLVSVNRYNDELTGFGGEYTTKYQGANIKDCYSNLRTHVKNNIDSVVTLAGAIAKNIDYSVEDYDNNEDMPIVQNYILGVYYNKDNLNYIEDGGVQDKNYKGIDTFAFTSPTIIKGIDFVDTPQIVYGLTNDEMKISSNFVSHTTKDIKFDEEGKSQGIVEEEVMWLFDTVWAIDTDVNNGMPYLNYQLVYIPDDFKTAGVAVMENQVTYKFIVDLEYAVTITSSVEGKLYITVNETYGLKLNPYNAQVSWHSSDENIVKVDENGVITGIAKGSATISATTRHGSSDNITVIVEEVSYTISGYPNKIIVNQDEIEEITGIVVTPATTLTSAMQITETGTGNPKYASAEVTQLSTDANNRYSTYKLKVTGLAEGSNRIFLTAGRTRVVIEVEVIGKTQTTTNETLQLTTTPSSVSGKYGVIASSGKVSVTSVKHNGGAFNRALQYTFKTSNSSVVEVINENSSTGTFEYKINGAGNATINVFGVYKDAANNIVYSGTATVSFAIQENTGASTTEKLTLNFSKAYLLEGNSFKLEVTSNNTNKVTFSSRNENIAKVSSTGVVTGVSANYNGYNTTNIVASTISSSGTTLYAYCQVTVVAKETQEPASLTLTSHSAIITSGSSYTVKATSNVAGIIKWYSNVTNTMVSYDTTEQGSKYATLKVTTTKDYVGIIKLTATYQTNDTAAITASATCIITVNGSQEYSQYIYTVDQLNAVRYNLDRDFYLAADLDLTGINWNPIGTNSKPFTGTFKAMAKSTGGFFSIRNMTTSAYYAGVFGYIKNANIQNLIVSNSSVEGVYAGAIAGYINASNLKACASYDNTINAYYAAGGIVGANRKGSAIDNVYVKNTELIATINKDIAGERFVGGIAGTSYEGTISNAEVTYTNMKLTSTAYGNVGGITGRSNYALKNLSVENCNIGANTNMDTNFAGGIVGYATGVVENGVVKSTNIQGYNAGGISGALNDTNKVTVVFSECKTGYRKEDLSSSSYKNVFHKLAVLNTVKIKGKVVGGLTANLYNGAIVNSYSRAQLEGIDSDSMKAGFAVYITASSMPYAGGTGYAGIIDYCYSACTFIGAGKNYSITSSLVHNYAANGEARPYGFVFNYVFDNDIDGKATYYHGSGFKDNVQAKKSTSEMKSQSTYTSKGFSTAHWNFGSDYPTLKYN